MSTFSDLKARVKAFEESALGQRLGKLLRWTFIAAVLTYLAYRLVGLGWQELWQSLPRVALFYVIFAIMYLVLPLLETYIYKITWNIKYWKSLPIFQKKRILNSDVVGYSGEVYLFMWARKNLSLRESDILRIIKDNTIISSVGSTFIAVTLLATFFFSGNIEFIRLQQSGVYVVAGILVFSIIVGLGMQFRKSIFTLTGKVLSIVLSLHIFRMVLLHSLQVLQWMVVLPDISLSIWFSFLAVKIVIQQLPFIPAKDLFFLGSSFEISQALGIPAAPIAGMLLVGTVLNKVTNAGSFLLITLFYNDPDIEKVRKAELNP